MLKSRSFRFSCIRLRAGSSAEKLPGTWPHNLISLLLLSNRTLYLSYDYDRVQIFRDGITKFKSLFLCFKKGPKPQTYDYDRVQIFGGWDYTKFKSLFLCFKKAQNLNPPPPPDSDPHLLLTLLGFRVCGIPAAWTFESFLYASHIRLEKRWAPY